MSSLTESRTTTNLCSRGRTADGAPNPIDIHIGRRIRTRRMTLGLSQEKLAELLGITFQQIQKYEKGINRISGSRLWDVSQVLRTEVGYFFEEMDKQTINTSPMCLSGRPFRKEMKISAADPMKSTVNCLLVSLLEKNPNRSFVRNLYLLAATAYPSADRRYETIARLFDEVEIRKSRLKRAPSGKNTQPPAASS